MIKFIFEKKEYTINDDFELTEKNNIIEKCLKIAVSEYTVDKGFKSKFVADALEKDLFAKILFVDDLDEQETETMVVY